MKKRSLVTIIALMALVLAGCGIKPEKFGTLFVDRVIYGKKSDELNKNISDPKGLDKAVNDLDHLFETGGVDSMITSASDKETAEWTKLLLKKVRSVTSYKVKEAKVSGKKMTITYEVYGLDFKDMLNNYLNGVVEEAKANAVAGEVTEDEVVEEQLKKAMNNFKKKDKPVEVTIDFVKEKGKWNFSKKAEDELENLFVAFYYGAEDTETFQREMREQALEMVNKIQDDME